MEFGNSFVPEEDWRKKTQNLRYEQLFKNEWLTEGSLAVSKFLLEIVWNQV